MALRGGPPKAKAPPGAAGAPPGGAGPKAAPAPGTPPRAVPTPGSGGPPKAAPGPGGPPKAAPGPGGPPKAAPGPGGPPKAAPGPGSGASSDAPKPAVVKGLGGAPLPNRPIIQSSDEPAPAPAPQPTSKPAVAPKPTAPKTTAPKTTAPKAGPVGVAPPAAKIKKVHDEDGWSDEEYEAPEVICTCRVIKDYIPTSNDDLTLILDDIVYVFKKSGDYWEGETKGVYGRFPKHYVKELKVGEF